MDKTLLLHNPGVSNSHVGTLFPSETGSGTSTGPPSVKVLSVGCAEGLSGQIEPDEPFYNLILVCWVLIG